MWGVCLRLLVKNMKGNDNDFVDILLLCSCSTICFNHLFYFLWMFLIFNFDTKLNDWRGYCSGRDVALFDWKIHGDSPNHLVYRWWSIAITAAHDAAVTHCFSVFLCLHVSVWMRVCGEMFSGLVLCLFVTLCWMNYFFLTLWCSKV